MAGRPTRQQPSYLHFCSFANMATRSRGVALCVRELLYMQIAVCYCICWDCVAAVYADCSLFLYRGADKSLARPGRKHDTATKLWLLQTTQKQFRMLSVQPGLRGSNDLRVGRKMATVEFFFQSGRAKDLSVPLYLLWLWCCGCRLQSVFVFFETAAAIFLHLVVFYSCMVTLL